MMKKYVIILFVSIILCSCINPLGSWEKDISRCNILNGYIGVPLKLQRDVGIIKESGLRYWHIKELNDPLYDIAIRQKSKNISDSYIGILNKGSILIIDSFRVERIYAGPIIILAVGKIEIPGEKEMQDFEYMWSDTWELRRAPWDDESIPQVRILKLDEHYNCID